MEQGGGYNPNLHRLQCVTFHFFSCNNCSMASLIHYLVHDEAGKTAKFLQPQLLSDFGKILFQIIWKSNRIYSCTL